MKENGFYLDRQVRKETKTAGQYEMEDLTFMTTFQLREICRKEKLVEGILNPLDKEELIRIILHFCGKKYGYIIKNETETGNERLQELFQKSRIQPVEDEELEIASKITVYNSLEISYYDEICIPYRKNLEGTNALLMSGDYQLAGIFYLETKGKKTDRLYLLKTDELPCRELTRNDYSLYCFEDKASEVIYKVYNDMECTIPSYLQTYRLPIIDFEVRDPVTLRMPAAIDFGSTNTTAGLYPDDSFFDGRSNEAFIKGIQKGRIHYTSFYGKTEGEVIEYHMIPSVIGVKNVVDGKPEYAFGHEAVRLTEISYVDEGFCVFYDIKRWVSDYDKKEEITDRSGRKAYVQRKEMLQAFFSYIIRQTENRFKCRIEQLHISCPVKQKYLFNKMFRELFPQLLPVHDEILDEGAAVLYNTIAQLIETKNVKEGFPYEVLMIDCGGGTTDLCASKFSIVDKKIAYEINIQTAYENGDTDFGGNNLTFRIMQLLKILLVSKCGFHVTDDADEIMRGLDTDVFRFVDEYGAAELYKHLDEEYAKTEMMIPTQFKRYEAFSKKEYYRVKNNYYYLFFLAEQIKKRFYERTGILSVYTASEIPENPTGEWIRADKWKISICKNGEMATIKEFPLIHMDLYTVELLLKGDIYGIIRKFIEPMYRDGRVNRFSFIKLTGQSCKINIFRSALKEFIPGKRIQFRKKERENDKDMGLKMVCVDGALKYIRDKNFGYADVILCSQEPVLPYTVCGFTHNGQEVELINGFIREDKVETISRNLENVTLELFLKDTEGNIRYSFHFDCRQEAFEINTCEEIEEKYSGHIRQKEMDKITNNEIKFFLWKKYEEWGYVIVPIYRKEENLYLGQEKFYPFENEGWIKNYFDGTK